MFIRRKVVKKNGREYVYFVRQHSVRIGNKVKSLYLGKADEVGHVPAVLEDAYNDKFNAENPTPYTLAITENEKAPTEEVKAVEAPVEAATPAADAPHSSDAATVEASSAESQADSQ